jgi:hypothetical protein
VLLSELLTNHPGSIIPIFPITRQRLPSITARSFGDLVCFGALPTWCRCRVRPTEMTAYPTPHAPVESTVRQSQYAA